MVGADRWRHRKPRLLRASGTSSTALPLVNVGYAAQQVALRRTSRHLSGSTDRLVNNDTVDRVTLPAQDGIILLDLRSPLPATLR